MSDKPKRGRPRKYDYVTITARAKIPIESHAGPEYFTNAQEYLESFVFGSITVEVNGKRVRKFGTS